VGKGKAMGEFETPPPPQSRLFFLCGVGMGEEYEYIIIST
jgi:hypothetical protein